MSFSVTYWNVYKDGRVRKTTDADCFSVLSSCDEGIKTIRYLCNVDERLDQKQIDFYLDFISKILTERNWQFKQLKIKNKRYILFTLDTSKNWHKYNVLFYLSAFRLHDEGFEIIEELYKVNKENFDTQFYKFQEIHRDCSDGKIQFKKNETSHTLDCHGIMKYGPYGSTGKSDSFTAIKYETLKERLKRGNIERVHYYFKSDNNDAPKPQIEQVVKLAAKPKVPLEPVDKLVKNNGIFD